jgi:hypothetical protein
VTAKKRTAKDVKADYQFVFGSEEGKRVLDDILAYCHVLEPLTGAIGTNAVMIREGRRDAAMTILQKMMWDERRFVKEAEGENQ